MEQFEKLLKLAAKKYNFTRTFDAVQVCAMSRKLIYGHFSRIENVEDKIKIHSFDDGVLRIQINNSSYNNLIFRETENLMDLFSKNELGQIKKIKTIH